MPKARPPVHHLLVPRPMPALLSLVIPAHDEEPMMPLLRSRVTALMDSLPCPCELWLVNDGSHDHTAELAAQWAHEDPRVRLVCLARNFGHQAAATAGLDLAQGDAIVLMDADLQDPPDVVHQMLARYAQGYDVVYGQRLSREGETWLKRVTAWGFYRLMRSFVHPDLPVDAGDFRLVSRRCLDGLRQMRETHRFLRGMVAWAGYAQVAVAFHRPARAAGETKYPLRKMLRFALTAAISFSPAPLRVSLAAGLVAALFGIGVALYAVARYVLGYPFEPGWTTLVCLLCILGGAILLAIGVLGEYVGRVYEEAKGRPLYLVADVIRQPAPASRGSRLEHLALNVERPAALADWLCAHLGLRVAKAGPPPVDARFLVDAAGLSMLELYHNDAAPRVDLPGLPAATVHLALACADLDTECARLQAAGCEVLTASAALEGGDAMAMLRLPPDAGGLCVQLIRRAVGLVRER